MGQSIDLAESVSKKVNQQRLALFPDGLGR